MLIVLVILKALHVWFYASLTNTSWVDTIISFLQVKKLRHTKVQAACPTVQAKLGWHRGLCSWPGALSRVSESASWAGDRL